MDDPYYDLSATAELLLRRLQAEPDRLRYDVGVFGGGFRGDHIIMLDEAYRELEEAGLVERSGMFTRFFSTPKRLYRLSERGSSLIGSTS